jgi:hypothetical protein
MALEYKPVADSTQWWVFNLPADGLLMSAEARSERKGTSTVEAIAQVGSCLLVKFTKDHNSTNAKTTLDTFFRRSGASGLSAHLPPDKAHFRSWGFYETEKEAQAEDLADEIMEDTEEELREDEETFTRLEAEAKQKAAEAEAAGNAAEAAQCMQEAAGYAEKLSIITLKLRLLVPQACLTNGPADETQDQLSLEAYDAQVTARKEELVQRIAVEGRMGIFQWWYGRADVLTCYVKRRMPVAQRLLYIRSRNANPTPLEFAKLFVELNSSERFLQPGYKAFDACRKLHKDHDSSFDFKALPTDVQSAYKNTCYNLSSCAVCGKPVAFDKLHCSKKCADNACECCDGPLELKVESREVFDHARVSSIQGLEGFLQLKGAEEPQQEKYHEGCDAKVRSCSACKDCQEKHLEWSLRHQQWTQLAREPTSFWTEKQQQLKELLERPEMTTIVTRKRVCVTLGCSGEERAAKRRRDADQQEREMVERLGPKRLCVEP